MFITCTIVLQFVLWSLSSAVLLYTASLVDAGDCAVISSGLQEWLLLPSLPLPTTSSTTTKSDPPPPPPRPGGAARLGEDLGAVITRITSGGHEVDAAEVGPIVGSAGQVLDQFIVQLARFEHSTASQDSRRS